MCLDELGMHKLKGDSTKGGSPRGGHESHLISIIYICGGNAGSRWGRRTGGGQRRYSRGYGWAGIITSHGWGLKCVPTGKRMEWTHIIVCHATHVITNVQTHLICCLTCLLHGMVMHECVTMTRRGHECVTPTRCGHGCVTLTRCGTLTKCGTPTRCMTLTRLTTSMPLTFTCLPTTPYNQFTCVARITCIVQGQSTDLFNRLQGINTVGVDLIPWFALRHYPQL